MTKATAAKPTAKTKASPPVKKATAKGKPIEKVLDPALYNEFISTLKLLNIDVAELGARCVQPDLAGQEVNIKSNFSISRVQQTGRVFTAEARLHLTFESESQAELGTVLCAYHLKYESDVELTEEIFTEFSRRNVPLNAWPFLRELVMNTTQRFGWSGFILPPFKVPAVNRVSAAAVEPARSTSRKSSK